MGVSVAYHFIERAMIACLPDGVPLAFTIDAARWIKTSHPRRAQADVTMFDGFPAKLEVWAWNTANDYAHRWTELPGGDATFEDGAWLRLPAENSAGVRAISEQGNLATDTPNSPLQVRKEGS